MRPGTNPANRTTLRDDRVVVASYPNYADAQGAVDRLSDARFPVEQTSIVGRDLRLVENVTGRLDYRRAALSGAAGGAWFGFLVGLFIGIFTNDAASWFGLLLGGLAIGAAAGALFSVIGYAATGGRRDFVPVSALVATQYDVTVDARGADDARRMLGLGSFPAAPYTPPGVPDPGVDPSDR